MKLRLSDDLVLPADFITSTQAILAKKRVGKTYTAQVLAEEMLAAKQQVVVIDLTSAWWGLRSSADAKSAGYPITIFGGRHGDLPLEATAGEALANAIVKDRFSAVLDVRLLKKGQRLRFIADFLETLYDKNTQAMHLFLDESDSYCPQQSSSPEQHRALGATDELVRRGGIGGIGVTLISQRPAVLNNNVLSQVDMLTVLRMNHHADLKQIRDWIVAHVDADRAKEMMASLPGLAKGQAWVWAPEMGIFKRVTVRAKRTYDSGRTPKIGERIRAPRVLASVDLERLGATIAATVEQAKANDPAALKAKIAELVRERDQLARAVNAPPKAKDTTEAKVVEKSLVTPADLKRFEALAKRLETRAGDIQLDISRLGVEVTTIKEVANRVTAFHKQHASPQTGRSDHRVPASPPARVQSQVSNRAVVGGRERRRPDVTAGETAPSGNTDGLKPAHLRLLSAIAWWESIGVPAPDLGGVAFIAKTSTKSSAFDNNRSRLRAAGYIDYPQTGRVALTEAGRKLAPPPSIPATNAALHDAVLTQVTPAVARMLRVLIEVYPSELSLEEFAQRAETSTTSSAFDNNRSWLRARGLSMYPRTGFVRATELLFPEGP